MRKDSKERAKANKHKKKPYTDQAGNKEVEWRVAHGREVVATKKTPGPHKPLQKEGIQGMCLTGDTGMVSAAGGVFQRGQQHPHTPRHSMRHTRRKRQKTVKVLRLLGERLAKKKPPPERCTEILDFYVQKLALHACETECREEVLRIEWNACRAIMLSNVVEPITPWYV